jgi:predicted transposase YdaD
MMSIPYKDPLTEHWAAAGRVEGRAEGREEGIEQGLARAKGEDLLKIMDARSLKPSEKQRAQVTSSTDLGRLDLWFDRALTADSADEVFRP